MEGLEGVIKKHPFFAGLDEAFCALIAGCAKNVVFQAGENLFHEGEPAEWFYLLRQGLVAMQVAAPGRGAVTFQTLGEGEIVGVSCLVAPYRWNDDAKAVELTRAVAMSAQCLRQKCESDHDLGYEIMKRFTPILIQRLHAAQLQLLDVYGAKA
ncbi:MAG TPA: cyclic nucleotide-binding domain-containing protein [Methylocystis sp.]|nr:cyclic nucleotide-binding domain-containing protein [Methylocystis sp.]